MKFFLVDKNGHNSASFNRRELNLIFLERQLNFPQDSTIFCGLAFLGILLLLVEFDSFLSQSSRFFADSALFIFKIYSVLLLTN